MSQTLIVDDLCISLPNGLKLVEHLSFRIEPGNVLALMGPSGSGKSSVLGWLTGTLDPHLRATGQVRLGETSIDNLPTEKRRLGLMLQQDYLFPHMSVGENLQFGLKGGNRQARHERVSVSLEKAGLANMHDRDPATLSGGQRARVALIRTLLSDPCALLLDEPFSRLDATMRDQIRRFTWAAASELPVLLVTHDQSDVPEGASVLMIGGQPDHLMPEGAGSFQ